MSRVTHRQQQWKSVNSGASTPQPLISSTNPATTTVTTTATTTTTTTTTTSKGSIPNNNTRKPQQFADNESGKKKSGDALPGIAGPASAKALRFGRRIYSKVSGESGTQSNISDKQTENRAQLAQTVAAHLLKAALDRQPNVLPVFSNDPETHTPYMLPKDEALMRPEKKLLMTPCLGLAASANAITLKSSCFPTLPDEAARRLEKERSLNRVLFSWWETRNACRQNEDTIANVEEELRGPLWDCFKQFLTEEEGRAMHELKQNQKTTFPGKLYSKWGEFDGELTTKSGLKTLTGKGAISLESEAVVANLPSSDRGISMPLELYERLFQTVMNRVHRRFLMLLRCQGCSNTDDTNTSLQSSLQCNTYIQFLLTSEIEMIEAGERVSNYNDAIPSYLPLVSLPEERCFRPLLAAETAFSVALLWRILDQTKSMVPGMAWALELFTKYLLPHVYENFTPSEKLLPTAGAIGEQVEQLHSLQLNLIRQRSMKTATVQAKEDVRYLETFMKSWAWRTWRQSAVGEKRRGVALMRLESIFKRLHNAIRLQKTFREWRLTAKEGRFKSQLDEIERKYNSFLTGAQHAARRVQFFPEFTEGMDILPSVVMPDKNKFVAIKLAETAQHTKGQKKTQNLISEAKKKEEELEDELKQNEDSLPSTQKPTQLTPKESGINSDSFSPTDMEQAKTRWEYVDDSNNKRMQPSDMKPIPQTFMTSIKQENNNSSEGTALQKRAVETFEGMLQKLEEMEKISGYLRQEIAIQNRLIQKLERENNSLKGRATELEQALFNSEEKRLHFCNLVQERELDVRELERRIAQLKSRVRCQQQRPWQRTVMRVVGEMCGASTTASEYSDDRRVARNMKTSPVETNDISNNSNRRISLPVPLHSTTTLPTGRRLASGDATSSRGEDAATTPNLSSAVIPVDNERVDRDNGDEVPELAPGAEEERLFGKIAPLVISSTRYMPDAQTILRDWANNCLDDLESLDDLKGGALSTRFHNFSEEVRSGVLISRLLFYLALPRYQNKTAVAHTTIEGTGKRLSENLDFTEQRRQLLMQHNVQLEAPFPTYSECFGDLLNLKPSGRMSLLLQFATELIEGPEQLGDEYIQKRMNRIREAAIKATEMTLPPAADRVEMMEVVDPYALARGDRSAAITLISLLYVRFAHPFNHKAKQSAMVEREAMLYLLSNGTYLRQQHSGGASLSEEGGKEETTEKTESSDTPITRELLSQLEEEERSPWQLFLKYCQPLISTMAHPFILRGNFWPSVAFDSPELAQMLGALGVALHRSLEVHRWHIIVSCLVPVNTYSSLSRGIFTGRRASPSALQVGLEREGDWVFAVDMPCIKKVFHQREGVIRQAIENGTMKRDNAWHDDEWRNEGYFTEMDKSYLMKAFGNCGNDLLQLFLRRSTLSSSCAMPSLDLGGWRLLWIDTGLVIPDDPEGSRVDLEQLTSIFYSVATTLMETRKESKVTELHMDEWNSQPLPLFVNELYYPDFLAAVVLLTHEMFPPLDPNTDGSTESITWLGDGLSQLIFKLVAPKLLSCGLEDPLVIVRGIRSSIKTEQVLIRYNKALMTIFHSYCKEVCGVSGMEREQLLHMLRDAMLTSTEISQNLIYELFQPFSVNKKSEEALREEKRREQDARPRDMPVQRRRGNVSILDPNSDQPMLTGRNKEFCVLLYDGFVDFLCVLCHFKQPNPLIPFDQRMETFLRRGLLRPLSHRNDVLASIMSNEKRQSKPESAS
ncbi:uncharacterized protein TM35_000162240 [Trypanosoma theileri]|uniref:Uncharacterized protein n=1 Tax=Trypanosoma theileri TaxID=67003 RepID=A0A1X0NV57_9TRYP|nr:uncharacterized protein TM35_000162240 [Trypanosoma theileri]ORC88586.1 hypothetical protein TM35_000162240 [Trypanosoma theileri]